MDKIINIKDLQIGMVIVQITRQNGPVKIRKSGLVSSPEMITGLTEMGVQEVEIDPEKTVEIDPPVSVNLHKKSQTLQLLESDQRSNHSMDEGLSDQFNRSLFLPSVQDIPSLWQYYAKRVITVTLIIFGGFGIGWSSATYQQWMPALMPEVEKVAVITQLTPTQRAVAKESQVSSADPVAETSSPDQPEVSQEQVPDEDDLAIEATDVIQQVINSEVSQSVNPSLDLNAEPSISPELLKRFEQAINQLDSEPVEEKPEEVQSRSDVQRIDQLPAWVMTELPSMAFSAHMYASNRDDRWVRVNGTRMVEGDKIDGKVRIQKIDQQHVILSYQGHDFSMAALTDW